MHHDAFTAGVKPGGLIHASDIKLLLCYLLSGVDGSISKADLNEIMQAERLANYFEVNDALISLVSLGNVTEHDGLYEITDQGKAAAQVLNDDLPLTVRDAAVRAAIRILSRRRNERENKVEIKQTETDFFITCSVMDGETPLLSVTLRVADRLQADKIKEQFLNDPEALYKGNLSLLTGDRI